MTMWRGYVIIVLSRELHIFSNPNSKGETRVISKMAWPGPKNAAFEAQFIDYQKAGIVPWPPVSSSPSAMLHIVMRSRDGISAFVLTYSDNPQSSPTFGLVQCPDFRERPEDADIWRLSMLSTGSIHGYMLWSCLRLDEPMSLPPQIVLSQLRPPRPSGFDTKHEFLAKATFLPTSGFPLLQLLSCWDFDDSRGLFGMGTSDGEVCLASFIEETPEESRSFVDDLPQAEAEFVTNTVENMEVCVSRSCHLSPLNVAFR